MPFGAFGKLKKPVATDSRDAGTLSGALGKLSTNARLRLRALEAQQKNKGPGGPQSGAAKKLLKRREIAAKAEAKRTHNKRRKDQDG